MTVISPRRAWPAVTGLILLSIVPVAASAFRVLELSIGAEITPANERYFASPVPVLVHVVSASIFCIVGAFQFVPGIRRHRPGWHRIAGRFLVVLGIAAALSALWMTLFYPRVPGDGDLVQVLRLVFGSGMLLALGLGFAAARRRDFVRHRAWMMRGYAIGLGAGTQALTHLPFLLLGPPDELARAAAMGAGWVINLAVAEWIIRRPVRVPAARL